MNNSGNLILYKASAGSGKTYTLAKAYLKILIQNPYDYNKILAVTFTKKATAEMKSRIIEYLSRLEKLDVKLNSLRNDIIHEIKTEKNIDVQADFDKHVRVALQLILHDYSNFNISTIDSFFQGIIRSFAKELDLPIGMEVELDTNAVIQHAVEAMLKEYKTDKDAFSRWIEMYVFDLIDEDKSWKIEKNISKLAKQILSEEYQLLTAKNNQQFDIETYKQVLKELKQFVFDYRKKLHDLTQQVQQKIQDDNLDLSQYFQGLRSIHSFINNVKKYEPEANSYIQKMLNGEPIFSKTKIKDTATIQQLENAWNGYLKPYIDAVLAYKEQHQKKYNSANIVLKNIYSLALLEFINTKIKQYKADENLILISDTNQIVSLIATNEEVPFIFEKSANFLKYILIDEFQDTSSLQWNGMLPLLLEILQNIDGLVLIVGDPKQSIYRWRGGKMELIIDGIASGLHYHWKDRKDISLKANYRSAKEIVQFNNAFFSVVKNTIAIQNPLFKDVLADVEQELIKEDKQGFVQCKWLEKNKDKEEDDVQLQEVLSIIQSLENTKKYSDIAILTRNNKHGALVANYLQENKIPVVSAESLLLQNQLSIKLLVAALEYITHSKEDFYSVKINYLYAKWLQKENIESYLIKQNFKPYFFEEKIDFLRKENIETLSSVAVNELLFLLIKELQIDAEMDSYLWRFQDVVLNFSQTRSTAVVDFLNHWSEKKDKMSILPPDGINAVKIYTIHKSKGLQFPVVIFPYCNWSMKPKTDATIWIKNDENPFDKLNAFPVEITKKLENSFFVDEYQKELEATYIDNINMLYVAFTRAEEQLYILSDAEKNSSKTETLPQNVSKLLYDIVPQLNLNQATHNINEFSYGNNQTITEAENDELNVIQIEPVNYHNFKEKMPLHRENNYNEAQIKGNILHTVLSKINQANQLRKAVATTTIEDVGYYTSTAQKVMEIFAEHNWFDEKWIVLNERNLYFNQQLLRADKVLLSNEECVIIDYKTGAKDNKHIQQMREYMNAYAMLYTQKISAYLVYIENTELIQVQ
jgi:ATP-dependent exoDNAse (exonuclease V) beta subunit